MGDGEAETGPTATAWHLTKLLDPAVNGAVLPILHLNGYKISGPTIVITSYSIHYTKLYELRGAFVAKYHQPPAWSQTYCFRN